MWALKICITHSPKTLSQPQSWQLFFFLIDISKFFWVPNFEGLAFGVYGVAARGYIMWAMAQWGISKVDCWGPFFDGHVADQQPFDHMNHVFKFSFLWE